MEKDFPIRFATLADAEPIYRFIQHHREALVPRSVGNIVESIDRFFVAEAQGELVGIASYQIHPELGDGEAAMVEIVSVAVRPDCRRAGLGRALVEKVIDRVSAFSPREILVLTFAPEFFASLDFVEVPKTQVMHKLYTGCINCTKHTDPLTCPEIAMKLSRR